jgi:hypothetical protein
LKGCFFNNKKRAASIEATPFQKLKFI